MLYRHARKLQTNLKQSVEPTQDAPQALSDSYLDSFLNTGTDIGRGIGNGVVGFGQSVAGLADYASENLTGFDLVEDSFLETKAFGETTTMIGGLTEAVTQFSIGFLATGALTPLGSAAFATNAGRFASAVGFGAKAERVGKIGASLTQGAVADFVSFQGNEARISSELNDLTAEYMGITNNIFGVLANREDEDEFVGRLKATVEGMGLGVLGEVLSTSVKGLRGPGVKKLTPKARGEQLKRELKDVLKGVEGITRRKPPANADEAARQAAETLRAFADPAFNQIETDFGGVVSRRAAAKVRPSEILNDVSFTDLGSDEAKALKGIANVIVDEPDKSKQIIGVVAESFRENAGLDALPQEALIDESMDVLRSVMTSVGVPNSKGLSELRAALSTNDVADTEFLKKLISHGSALRAINGGLAMKAQKEASTLMQFTDGAFKNVGGTNEERRELLAAAGARFTKAIDAFVDSVNITTDFATKPARFMGALEKGGIEGLRKVKDPKRASNVLGGILTRATEGQITGVEDLIQLQKALKASDDGLEGIAKLAAAIDAAPWEDTEGLVKAVNAISASKDQGKAGLAAVFAGNILISPASPTRDFFGTGAMALAQPLERIVGGPAAFAAGNVSGSDARREVISGMAEFYGMSKALFTGVDAAFKSAWSGKGILDPDINKMERLGKMVKAHADGEGKLSFNSVAEGYFGLVMRPFMAAEEFWKQLLYRGKISSIAAERVWSSGGAWNDVRTIMGEADRMYKEAFNPDGSARNLEALGFAREGTFTSPRLNKVRSIEAITEAGEEVRRRVPATQLIVPFIRTPSQILQQTIARTPVLGQMTSEWHRTLREGSPQQIGKAYGEMSMGLMLSTAGVVGASHGIISGNGPQDSNTRRLWEAAGNQQNSIKVFQDGNHTGFVSYAAFEPFTTIMSLFADVSDIIGQADESQKNEIVSSLMVAMSDATVNKTYLRNVHLAIDAAKRPQSAGKTFTGNLLSGFIPAKGLINFVWQSDKQAEAREIMDRVAASIPGLSAGLDPRRNILGDVVLTPRGLHPDVLLGKVNEPDAPRTTYYMPFYGTTKLGNEVYGELIKLRHGFRLPGRIVGQIDLSNWRHNENQSSYDRWMELTGEVKLGQHDVYSAVSDVIKSDRYRSLPENSGIAKQHRIDMINDVIGRFRDRAMRIMLKENPRLRQALRLSEAATKTPGRVDVANMLESISNADR